MSNEHPSDFARMLQEGAGSAQVLCMSLLHRDPDAGIVQTVSTIAEPHSGESIPHVFSVEERLYVLVSVDDERDIVERWSNIGIVVCLHLVCRATFT
jgi:hypothetical protein